MSGKLIDRLLKKKWSADDVARYVGNYQSAFLSHSVDVQVREKAASGGTTTSMLIHGLANGHFDGAVVCKTVLEAGKVRPHFIIATKADDVLASRGSKYVETRFLHEVLPLIRSFDGRVAVVGLPCDITALKRRCCKEPDLDRKVVLTYALVCGHNSRTVLIDEITARIEREAGKKLRDYRFRVGHWRGQLEAEFDDGTVLTKPTKFFNDYQNLFFFSQRKCMSCNDHYGYDADISVGDVWLFRLRDDSVKNTGVIIRTDAGLNAYTDASNAGVIESSELDIQDIMDGQSRIGPSHYNVSARCKAGRVLGVNLQDTLRQPVSWHAYLNAMITLGNVLLSEKEWGRKLIFRSPRPVLKAYLYFKKVLESLN